MLDQGTMELDGPQQTEGSHAQRIRGKIPDRAHGDRHGQAGVARSERARPDHPGEVHVAQGAGRECGGERAEQDGGAQHGAGQGAGGHPRRPPRGPQPQDHEDRGQHLDEVHDLVEMGGRADQDPELIQDEQGPQRIERDGDRARHERSREPEDGHDADEPGHVKVERQLLGIEHHPDERRQDDGCRDEPLEDRAQCAGAGAAPHPAPRSVEDRDEADEDDGEQRQAPCLGPRQPFRDPLEGADRLLPGARDFSRRPGPERRGPDRRAVPRGQLREQLGASLRDPGEDLVAAGQLLAEAVLEHERRGEAGLQARLGRADGLLHLVDPAQHQRWRAGAEGVGARARPRLAERGQALHVVLEIAGVAGDRVRPGSDLPPRRLPRRVELVEERERCPGVQAPLRVRQAREEALPQRGEAGLDRLQVAGWDGRRFDLEQESGKLVGADRDLGERDGARLLGRRGRGRRRGLTECGACEDDCQHEPEQARGASAKESHRVRRHGRPALSPGGSEARPCLAVAAPIMSPPQAGSSVELGAA